VSKRKQTSEFHKRIQGSAYSTLKSAKARKAIEDTAAVFASEFPEDCGAGWEALCAIRDHVNALTGAWADVDATHREDILSRIKSGEFKDDKQGALDLMNSRKVATVAELHTEVDRQGIPEI